MQSKWMRRAGLAALMAGVTYVSVGCAAEREPVNYVQPNALDKSFFVGPMLRDASDDPEFYMRTTIVDVPFGTGIDGLFSPGYSAPLTRIKWDIQEGVILARLTYERIQDSDHKGSKRTNDGTIVAMFKVDSHFDVKRKYNEITGEDLNVVEENSSDRPWYDRQYIRVDWSKNLVTDAYQLDTLSFMDAWGVKYSPLDYKVEDPQDPNRPNFVPDEGYFDVTQKAWANPEIWHTQWGDYPACFFTGQAPVTNCNANEITLRMSFRKVEDHDFEVVEWDGKKMDAFGAFYEERFGYDRNFGLIDQNWHRFAARHNVWEKSHIEGSQCNVDYWRDENGQIAKYKTKGNGDFEIDANGMPIPDPNGKPYPGTKVGFAADGNRDTHGDDPSTGKGTDDDCEFFANGNPDKLLHKGAYCDKAASKCALPLYERKIRTSPWYFGPDSKEDLFASTTDALNQWNIAIKYALIAGMKAEAARVGETVPMAGFHDPSAAGAIVDNADLETALNLDHDKAMKEHKLPAIDDVFTMCHNPTIDSDHPACFHKDATGATHPVFARVGDIRYHMVNLIQQPQVAGGLWGIMGDAVDPLTGEKISASVNEWIQVLDLVSQQNLDLIKWINGEITDSQVTSGEYLRDWVKASELGQAPHIPKTLTKEDILKKGASIDKTLMSLNGLTEADKQLPKPLRIQKATQNLAKLGPSLDPEFIANKQRLIGSRWEAMMITPEMKTAAGLPADATITDDRTLAMLSPLRGRDPAMRKWFEDRKAIGMASRHMCAVEQPEPNGMVGLARKIARDYPLVDANKAEKCPYDPTGTLTQNDDYPACRNLREKNILKFIRERFHVGVIAHEMGHSMALRHNFVGSADAFNYHQEYWQLRTQNGTEKLCEDSVTPHVDGKECVGPRWVDPVTEDEVNGMIWQFAMTTVMDYPGDATQDMKGLGAYDKAAMRFIYGNLADVDEDATLGGDKGKAFVSALDGPVGHQGIGDIHYSKTQDKFKLITPADGGDDRKCVLKDGVNKSDAKALDYVCPRYSKVGSDVEIGRSHRLLHVPLRDMQTVAKYDVGNPEANATLLKLRPDLVANFAVYNVPNSKLQLVRHPYQFSSDEYADHGNMPIYRHDAGADPWEMMQFVITSYENRYIFDNFRRDRTAFDPWAVNMRIMGRYFDKLHAMAKSFFLRATTGSPSDVTDVDALQSTALGTADALETFVRVLTRPEPGTYVVDSSSAKTKIARVLSPAELKDNPGGDFRVSAGSGEGRFVNNDYDYSKGELWERYPLVAGSWFEKYVAMYYLMEAENNYVSNSKDDYIDGRYKNLNYASIYPNQIRRLLANLMQGDITSLGPYASSTTGTLANNAVARVQYLPWHLYEDGEKDLTTTVLDYPSDGVVLNPLYGWKVQFPGLLYMFAYGNSKLVMDTTAQARIFSTGDAATVSILPTEQVRFTDPFTSITYVARSYGQEVVNRRNGMVEKTVGARMLQYANALAEATYKVVSKDPVTGDLTYERDAAGGGNPVCKLGNNNTCQENAAKLKSYASNIDATRQFSLWFGYGPL